MEDQRAHDSSDGFAEEQESRSSETEAEIYEAVDYRNDYRRLFNDALIQSGLRADSYDTSGVLADSIHASEVQVNEGSTGDEACGYGNPTVMEDELFSGPAEWQAVWEWDVSECNRMVAEQNTLQYDEVEDCSDSDEGVDDGAGFECDDEECDKDCCLEGYDPRKTCSPGQASYNRTSAPSCSADNETVYLPQLSSKVKPTCSDYSQAASSSSRITNSALTIEDDEDFQSIFDEVLDTCGDSLVLWDSEDECGLTDLDREHHSRHGAEFSRDRAANNSSRAVPVSHTAPSRCGETRHQVSADSESDRAASSLFSQRPTYNQGAYARPGDSKWSLPHMSASNDDETCRWRARKTWRNNSADGLDSAGCSPKDDEDDDESDDDVTANCGAAALKQNKVSPASGYHARAGPSFYYNTHNDENWLAKYGDRQHMAVQSEGSSGHEPSAGAYYGRCQRYQPDDSTAANHTNNSNAVVERMQRRKQARRDRESAGFTVAETVAGYRGKDCSLEELIEYIDAKPPAVPKTAQQKQSCNRKNRKKKRGRNQVTSSNYRDNKSATTSAKSGLSGKATDSFAAVVNGSNNSNLGNAETALASGNGGSDSELSELPLRCDTFFQMLPSDISSSSASEADNNMEFMANPGPAVDPQCSTHQRLGSMSAFQPVCETDLTDTDLAINFGCSKGFVDYRDLEHTESESAQTADIGRSASSGRDSNSYTSSCSAELDKTLQLDEDGISNVHNEETRSNSCIECDCSEASSSRSTVDTELDTCEYDSLSAVSSSQNTHKLHSCSTVTGTSAVCQEVSSKTVDSMSHPGRTPAVEMERSTPCSSISDARDSMDLDSQSFADDISSDFDYSALQSLHDSEFTVVMQKKKKKPAAARRGECVQRTFYNRSQYGRPASLQSDSISGLSSFSTACSVYSNSVGFKSVPTHSPEMPTEVRLPVGARIVTPPAHNRGLVKHSTTSDTDSIESLSCGDAAPTSNSSTSNTSSVSENMTRNLTSSAAASLPNPSQKFVHRKVQENVFLDTRKPDACMAAGFQATELSFWFDVNVCDKEAGISASTNGLHEPSICERPSTDNSASFVRTAALATTTAASSSDITFAGDVLTNLCADSSEQIANLPPDAANAATVDNVDEPYSNIHRRSAVSDSQTQTEHTSAQSSTSPCCRCTSRDSQLTDNDSVNSISSSPVDCNNSPADSAFVADASQRSYTGNRRQFDLTGARLFLCNGFRQVISEKSRNPECVIYYTDADKDSC